MSDLMEQEGFKDQKLIILGEIYLTLTRSDVLLNQLYVTDIGHFPWAQGHWVDRNTPIKQHVLIYCVAGNGFIDLGEGPHIVSAEQYFVIPAGQQHCYGSETGWQVYWVHFSGLVSKQFIDRYYDPEILTHAIPGDHFITDRFEEMINMASQGLTIKTLRSLHFGLWSLLACFLQDEAITQTPERVQSMKSCIDMMHQHVDQSLSLELLAEYSGLSISHFSFSFKEITGMSPIEYHLQLRMQNACRLLITTELKIAEVARRCGYVDHCYFSKMFKRSMSISPSQYRAKHNMIG